MMQDSSQEIPLLTFNSLYNLLREEKKGKKLTQIDELFYKATEKYFKDKDDEIAKLKKEDSSEKFRKEKLVLKNSKKIMQELLNLRCMKIADVAIKNQLFGEEILPEKNILEDERELFESFSKAVKKIKNKCL